MHRQRRHVAQTFAQRRQFDRKHRQPVPEILAKAATPDHRAQILMGRCDDTRIHGDGPLATNPLHQAVLQHAQQPHLRR